ncbi:MAG: hypothetical protein HC880_14095 [Bacteroidia bacterium]|nr:hypothetical protein [Bacteroidia bacterium]
MDTIVLIMVIVGSIVFSVVAILGARVVARRQRLKSMGIPQPKMVQPDELFKEEVHEADDDSNDKNAREEDKKRERGPHSKPREGKGEKLCLLSPRNQ